MTKGSKKMEKDTTLEKLKFGMLNLQSGNLDVEAENPSIVKCWERLGCDKTDCPAYGKLRCWSIAGTLCHQQVRGLNALKLGDCRKCVVYRESCSDEVTELLEIFNQTVKELKYHLSRSERRKIDLERNAAMEQMAATVAHEARNPLQAITLATNYLKKHFSGDLLVEFLSIIETEVKRLNGLIESFLVYARPSAGEPECCDLNGIAADVATAFSAYGREKGVLVTVKPAGRPALVVADRVRLRQMVDNLVANAIEFSRPDSQVALSLKSDDESVVLTVTDRGCGMTEEVRANALKPFFTTKTRGSGLGLALVDRTVRELGGDLHLSSVAGGGTEVRVRLPLPGIS